MLHLTCVHPNHNFHVKNCKFTNLKIAHQSQEVFSERTCEECIKNYVWNTQYTHHTQYIQLVRHSQDTKSSILGTWSGLKHAGRHSNPFYMTSNRLMSSACNSIVAIVQVHTPVTRLCNSIVTLKFRSGNISFHLSLDFYIAAIVCSICN
jgi:hypothetical protein